MAVQSLYNFSKLFISVDKVKIFGKKNTERFYPNGVKSNVLIKLFEEIDYNVITKYLTEQVEIFESNKLKQQQTQTKGAKDRNVAGESDNEVCY